MSDQEKTEKINLSALHSTFQNMRRVWSIVWHDRKVMLSFTALTYVIGAGMPFLRTGAGALLVNHLVSVAGKGIFDSRTILYAALLVVAEVLPSFVYTFQWYLDKLFRYYFEALFTMKVYSKMAALDVANHEDPATQDVFIKVTENGIWRVQSFMSRQFYITQNIFEILIAAGVLLYAKWWIFLLLLVAVIPELYVEMNYAKEVWGIYGTGAERRRRFWSLTSNVTQIRHLIELKLFQNIKKFTGLIRDLFVSFQELQRRLDRKKLSLQLGTQLFSQCAIAIATVWFVHEILSGEIGVGTFIFLLSSMGSFRQSLSGFFSNIGSQYQDNLFVEDVFNILDMPGKIAAPLHPIVLSPEQTPDIELENVFFRYPGSDVEALRGIDLVIPAGTKLAIVGLNGAGKTTIVKLLARFYDPMKGRILINGKDLRDIEIESWHRLIGALFQEFANYDSFTVEESIALGNSAVPFDAPRVRKAAHSSEANVFIEEWKKEYQSTLGKEFAGGVEPSTGQRQKLALARVFYRNPRIWILDEPTAAIDAESEAHIFDQLAKLPKDRTVILISHRFSTVRHADTIVVIDGGKIKEMGTHNELVLLGGEYARLFALQAKGYQ